MIVKIIELTLKIYRLSANVAKLYTVEFYTGK